MNKVKAFIFNIWTLTILVALAVTIVIYFIGPLISIGGWTPLASTSVRWISIACILFIWQAARFYKFIKSKNEEHGFLDNLFIKKTDPNDDISKNERETLELKFKDAFASLKKSSKIFSQKFNLYEIPWYIIIGPPGSGKTTALVNSGLKFPLSKEFGDGAIQGIGGTRNCDWWFTDQGIIIDTAGRYTTQDSHKEVDKSAWQDFLKLLKKFRKRRPINGVFVTISLQELLLQTPDQRALHVAAISNRLQELKDVFKTEFPVYVLVTKSDLIAGFEEYFDNFGKTERDQVWGMTFPYSQDQGQEMPINGFSGEFDALLQTLNERLIPRLHQERDQQRAQKIGAFPKQVQSIKPVLEKFLQEIFENSRYSNQLMLRGCYFCSGTQEGTPIDRLMNKLSGPAAIPVSRSKGKSFFIKNLFENIVFKESNLVGSDLKLEKKLKLFNGLGVACILLISVVCLGAWGISYQNNSDLIDNTAAKISELDQQITALSATDLSVFEILPILNAARALPAGYNELLTDSSEMMGMGLNQTEKIGDSSLSTYRETLKKILLPRLIVQTENQIADSQSSDNYTYAALRNYLMLGSEEHYNAEEISTFYHISWLQTIAAELTSEQYEQLSSHLKVLFKTRPVPLPVVLDTQLIKQTQINLADTPLESTIYSRLTQTEFPDLPPFTIYDKAGKQAADTVFIRKSGKSLSEGIEAFFSKNARNILFKEKLEVLSDEVLKETWVYGDNYQERRSIDKDELIKAVKNLYEKDYIDRYSHYLNDIDIAPFASYDSATEVLNILSGKNAPSPLQLLLEAIKAETNFDLARHSIEMPQGSKLQEAQDRLKRMMGNSTETISKTISSSSDQITAHFKPLHQLVSAKAEGEPIPLEGVLGQLTELYKFISKVAAGSRDGSLEPSMLTVGEEKLLSTRQLAKAQPRLFVSPYLDEVVNRTSSLTFSGVMIHINQLWSQESYEFCVNAVNDNYPFTKRSSSEISLNDFADVFGYGGVLDSFFSKNLKQYINTSKSPWKVHQANSQQISISNDALTAFEKAHAIRKAFFKPGSKQVATSFKMSPEELDDGLRGFYLDVDGQSTLYEFGPIMSESFVWPGPNPGSGSHFTLRQVTGNDIVLSASGDWAWFRLLDKVRVKRSSGSSKFNIRFKASGYSAFYNLTAGGTYNPYRLGSKLRFKCPTAL